MLITSPFLLPARECWANAKEGASQVEIRLGAGIPISANEFNKTAKTGVAGGLRYLYQWKENIGIGGQVDYFSFGEKKRAISLSGGNINAKFQANVLTAEVVGKYSLMTGNRFSPYGVGGVGVSSFSQETKGTPVSGSSWVDTGTTEERLVADDSSTSFAASFGIGVDTYITENIFAALEANWHVFGVDSGKFGTSVINTPSVFLRTGWQFGGK